MHFGKKGTIQGSSVIYFETGNCVFIPNILFEMSAA